MSTNSKHEAALEHLLQQVDRVIDRRREMDDTWDDLWAYWERLPFGVRDWLLAYTPVWWSLPTPTFRRLLLFTARDIVREGIGPRGALLRAAQRLRLPPRRSLASRASPKSTPRLNIAPVAARMTPRRMPVGIGRRPSARFPPVRGRIRSRR